MLKTGNWICTSKFFVYYSKVTIFSVSTTLDYFDITNQKYYFILFAILKLLKAKSENFIGVFVKSHAVTSTSFIEK